jgi:hypothetical protein
VVVVVLGELSCWTARCWAAGDAAAAHTSTQLPFGHWLFIVGYNVTFDRPPRRQRMPTCADNGHRASQKVPPMQPRFFISTFSKCLFFSFQSVSLLTTLSPSRIEYSLRALTYSRPNGIFRWDSNASSSSPTNTLKSRMSYMERVGKHVVGTHLFSLSFYTFSTCVRTYSTLIESIKTNRPPSLNII